MDIHSFETLPSTQAYLVEAIRQRKWTAPVAVIAEEQTDGHGSRGNLWEGGNGNLLTSVAVRMEDLPNDLPLQSASIYAGWLMRQSLRNAGESVWLKWPNDLYTDTSKVGGIITQKVQETLVIGIGVNLKNVSQDYTSLQSPLTPVILLNMFLERLQRYPKWKQIFSQYAIEFELSRAFSAHQGRTQIDLQHAHLLEDGSIEINGERIHSLR